MRSFATLAVLTATTAILPPLHAQTETPVETAADPWTGFSGGGNEPFWTVTISDNDIAFEHLGVFAAIAPRSEPQPAFEATVFTSHLSNIGGEAAPEGQAGSPVLLIVEDRLCSDSMSGLPFPKTLRMFVAGRYFDGCGGDTQAVLADGAFAVRSIGGEAVPEGYAATIAFDGTGGLSGSGGCNRYHATYELTDGLSIGPVAATRMACPGPAGDWEQRLFAAFGSVIAFEIADDGTLTLFSTDGPVVTATR